MAIDFPASPTANQTFTVGSITYKWDGAKWIGLGVTPADRLVEGSNSLEINANNDLVWTGDSVLLGTATANVNDRLTIHDPGSAFMSIRSDVASDGNSQVLDFGVGTADRSSSNLTAVIAADIHSTSGGTLKADLVFQTNAGNNISDKARLTSDGDLAIGHNSPLGKLHVRAADECNFIVREESTSLVLSAETNSGRDNNRLMTLEGAGFVFNSGGTEYVRVTSDGRFLIGTDVQNSFNGVGSAHNLIVTGSTSDGDITDNSSAAITISNRDGTADNTCGLHFAREDNDGNPHYCGASIVSQFKEAQVTGQYPKADLAFLTSTAANTAPSEKMRIYADGSVTKPGNPLIQTNMTDQYGAAQSLTTSPPSAICQGTASISRGTNGFTTTGGNAFTYVCPVDGIYAVFAHISLGNVTEPDGTREAGDRTIWTMAYTLGGGNLPLQNYVEIIDTNVFDFENASYYNVWNFTAGTRVGCGLNSGNGQAPGLALQWGVHLIQ